MKRAARDNYYNLSSGQKRLWFSCKLEPNSFFYNRALLYQLNGRLNQPALKKALQTIVERHEALRANFKEVEGQPIQTIRERVRVRLGVKDLTGQRREQKEKIKEKLIKKLVTTPFCLERDLLLRTRLIKLAKEKHIFVAVIHHLVFDNWSANLFGRELAAFYNAYSQNKPNPLPRLAVQYQDYVNWEQQRQKAPEIKSQEKYWLKKLGGELPILTLPTNRPRPVQPTHRGGLVSLTLAPKYFQQMKNLTRQTSTTLFMLLLAAFEVFLYRLIGRDDLILGTFIANRPQELNFKPQYVPKNKN